MERYGLDHTCPGCGAPAERVPAAPPDKGLIVTVLHAYACPVAIRVRIMRTKAAAGGRR